MLGFKSFWSARATLAGIELWRMFKKGQNKSSLPAWEQFYVLAAAAQLRLTDAVSSLMLKLATEPISWQAASAMTLQRHSSQGGVDLLKRPKGNEQVSF